jgi:hypothetical protein
MNLTNYTPTFPAPHPFTGYTVLTVQQDGAVGLGTTQPTQRLTIGSGNIELPNPDRGYSGNLYFGGITDAGQTGLRLFGGLVNGAIPAGFIDVRTTDPTDGLRIRVDTGDGGTERMRITAGGNVVVNGDLTAGGNVEVNKDLVVSPAAGGVAKIGVYTTIQPPTFRFATLQVDQVYDGYRTAAIHSGGGQGGYSFASRAYQNVRWDGTKGQRWELYAASDFDDPNPNEVTSSVRLWTYGGSRLFVTYWGDLLLGEYGLAREAGPGTTWTDVSVTYPQIPLGTLTRPIPDPPNRWSPAGGELVLGGIRTSIRGFDGPIDDPTRFPPGLRTGAHWIRTNGHESELWMGFLRLKFSGFTDLLRGLVAAVPWTAPSFNVSSDARLKTNIRQVEGALDRLERIRGVTFERAETESPYALGGVPRQPSIGVVAQEVEEVFPELVSIYDPDQEYRAVDYDGLTGVLIEAVKDLKAQNEALRSRIEALERAKKKSQ